MTAIIVISLLVLISLNLYLIVRKPKTNENDQTLRLVSDWMKQIKDGSDETRREMQKSIGTTNREINERLDNAAKVIGTVSKELGHMQEIGKSLSYVQEFLISSKKRGTIGEQIMEEMLRQSLPANMYSIQYHFKTGDIADSIIKINDRLLAMDSKFSMENYRAYIKADTEEQREAMRKLFVRDVKKRIDDISKKYILPEENTLDFALMYVPADGVFNELSDDVEVYEYARQKQVHLVSPSTFYYFLQVILIGLQGTRFNEQAQHVLKVIQGLRKDSEKFGDNLAVLTKHVTNAKSTLELVGSGYERIHNKIDEVSNLRIEQQSDEKVMLP
ncbi:MAG: DNA recombination protein RmuC [bacterium]|nr:DNA recombination protein RmuC [bacterium]